MVSFTLYSLQLSGVISLGYLYSSYIPLLVWLPFVAFMLNPFPIICFHGRLYFFKLVLKVIMSPFLVIDFMIILGTANAISLLNVFQDITFTICYYSHLDIPLSESQVHMGEECKSPARVARFVYTIFIYSIRIIQCLRVGVGIGSDYWNKKEIANTGKFVLALLTAILSYLWKEANKDHIFPVWVVFACLSTLFSCFWDFKISWDLLHRDSSHWMLRSTLLYPVKNYYVWGFINFVLRATWTLNISPNILINVLGSAEIFTLVFGFLEIIRRGIWNLMRVEVEQIRNNSNLKATPKDYDESLSIVHSYLDSHK